MSRCLAFCSFGGIIHVGLLGPDDDVRLLCTGRPTNRLMISRYDPAKVKCKRCRRAAGLDTLEVHPL